MELMRDFESGIVERIEREPAFARALLDQVDEVLKAGEPGTARGMLRALIKGTVGFDSLSRPLSMTGDALHRMLSAQAKPTASSLGAVVSALKRELGVAAS